MKELIALIVFLLGSFAAGEDLKLRERAVALLERANAVSSPAVWPPHDEVISFRYFSSTEGTKDGVETRVWLGPRQHRREANFGDFHLLNIVTPNRVASKGENTGSIPAPLRKVDQLVTLDFGRFDHEDIIKSISDGQVRGSPAQCIEFDTRFGTTVDDNEICVDKENGALLRKTVHGETTENSEFFPFAGALLPGRIDYFLNGRQVLEVHDETLAIEGTVDPNVFSPPVGAYIWKRCKQYRRAFVQQGPQPPTGNGGQVVDLVVSGTIAETGRLNGAVVELSDRPDLQQEALETAARWIFTPAMCDGKPTSGEARQVRNPSHCCRNIA